MSDKEAKKKIEYVIVDSVRYEKGKEPKKNKKNEKKALAEEGGENTGTSQNPPTRRDIQASDYTTSPAQAKRKADHAQNN